MQSLKRELTKEQYEALKKLDRFEQEKVLFPTGIPIEWSCGYGYYGHCLVIRDGKYYAVFSIGNSCD